jgi:transposase
MHINEIFAQALPLPQPWIVTSSDLAGDPAVLTLNIEIPLGTKLACPECDKDGCGVHDRVEKSWRHLNFWQYETYIHARVPRVNCPDCGVHQSAVPWAREGSGFTLLFEAVILALCSEMPVTACARIVGEHDTRLWRVIKHYVNKAHKNKDWSKVTKIGVDETSRKKGHNYVTNFVDTATGDLLFMTPGKGADTFELFVGELGKHKGEVANIEEVAMDMSPAFRGGAAEHLPEAAVVYDRFHVMQMVGDAVETVRKGLGRLGKGAMWALRGNASRLKAGQKALRESLCKEHKTLGRAMALRGYFQDLWIYAEVDDARDHFESWYSWARRCRLEPFKDLAMRLRNHIEGILAYYRNWTTSAMIESINGKLQLARKRARGYRNIDNFRAIAYWIAGGIEPAMELPNPLSMPRF